MGGLSGLSGLRGLSGLTARPAAGGFDADAQTFFTDADITDATQRTAVNDLVVGLKANGTWSKYHVIYPLVGGTASRHSFNLKNPATFRITWSGGVTHNSNGITGNGSTGVGNTGYTPSTSATIGDNHISIYSRTDRAFANLYEMGSMNFGGAPPTYTHWGFTLKNNGSNSCLALLLGGDTNPNPFFANSDSRGFYTTTRSDTISVLMYRNGSSVVNTAQPQSVAPSHPISILALNQNGSNVAHSTVELAFTSIGLGLTAAQAAADYTTIQAFQTALSRQV